MVDASTSSPGTNSYPGGAFKIALACSNSISGVSSSATNVDSSCKSS
eukprot:CAMPEP_0170340736 /NCGR_PEP_ID=MMETSP0116_2-20130129/71479_1 /TAXON_ID=400756 /ORGANISM="Durinskia baltica, Strain CSIRO CS-38" /LENGTH=46 /DNA_ID= /DNA_START= /DNA_END= /DNA_ORIENTATION=